MLFRCILVAVVLGTAFPAISHAQLADESLCLSDLRASGGDLEREGFNLISTLELLTKSGPAKRSTKP